MGIYLLLLINLIINKKTKKNKTLTTLELINIKEDKLGMLMRSLCIVLQLGNITFTNVYDEHGNENGCIINDDNEFDKLIHLLYSLNIDDNIDNNVDIDDDDNDKN